MSATARTTRVRGLAPWQPQRATLALLEQVRAVLAEYEQHLPMTVRQIFYRLVGAHGYDKNEAAYSRLGEHLNRARRAGMIPMTAIRDDGTTLAEPDVWDSAAQLVRTFIQAAGQFQYDRQRGQAVRLIFAVEAAGMVPQVQRVADPFGIAVHSTGGFDSFTAKHELAESLGQWPAVEVLHIGDHDPSGTHIFSSLAEDVEAIARDLGLSGAIRFKRLAVTPEQIAAMGLPTAPAKETDRRSFTGETTQVESIPPDALAGIVRNAIESRLDAAAYAAVLADEQATRLDLSRELMPLATRWGGAP